MCFIDIASTVDPQHGMSPLIGLFLCVFLESASSKEPGDDEKAEGNMEWSGIRNVYYPRCFVSEFVSKHRAKGISKTRGPCSRENPSLKVSPSEVTRSWHDLGTCDEHRPTYNLGTIAILVGPTVHRRVENCR